MKCRTCKGTGLVALVPGVGDEPSTLAPAIELGGGVMPCIDCGTTGIHGQDYAPRDFGLLLPPDDDGTPGGRIDVNLRHYWPVGSVRRLLANVEFVSDDFNFTIKELTPGLLRVIAEEFRGYADRMEGRP